MTITIERPETEKYLAKRFQFSTTQPAIGIKSVNCCLVIEGGEIIDPTSGYWAAEMTRSGNLVWPRELPFDLDEFIPVEGPVLVEIGTDPDSEEGAIQAFERALAAGDPLAVQISQTAYRPRPDEFGEDRSHGSECNCMDCRSENRAYANSYEGD